jgi:hypothetical protein
MATIKVKNSVTSGSNPSGLTFGELAVNITDKKIYIGNAVGSTVTLHDQNNLVTSVNGSTGDITNVAKLNSAQTFVAKQDFNRGISASDITGSNVIDVIGTNDGCGLRIAQADSGSFARVGGIRLGRSTTNSANSYIENYVGQLKFFNGISGTNATPGTNMLQLSTTNAIFGVPIAGATFTSVAGEVSIQKTVVGPNDSAYLRIVASDVSSNSWNSDIKGNTAAVANTVHTLPATTGTLLNTSSTINASTVTATASNVNATRYLTFVGGAGDTGIFIDPTTTPLTYTPAGGAIGAKKVVLTTSSNVITVDSAFPNFVMTDGTNISTFGVDSFSASYINPFVISNSVGLSFQSNSIAFETGTGTYVFPNTNGSNGQVLTTNGAGTLSWTTASGGVSSVNGITGTVGITGTTNEIQVTNSSPNITIGLPDSVYITNALTVGGGDLNAVSQITGLQVDIGDPAANFGPQYYVSVINDTLVDPYGFIVNAPSTFGYLANFNAGLIVNNYGATFNENIYAPNIVTSVNGQTGAVTVSGGGGGFTYASSAPSSPSVGDRWIDSDTGKEYVYVSDGSSSQWIEPVSSNGLVGVTYTSATNFLEFGVTGSFVKLGVNNTSPQYTLDVNGIINTPVGISAAGATFSGAVTSDGGYRITSSAINAQTGTTYTLLSADNGKIITMNNGSAITLTVPSGLPIGFNTTVIQLGAGQVGITGSSTTLNSFESKFKLAGQHAAASIISYTTNVFNVAGGLTA